MSDLRLAKRWDRQLPAEYAPCHVDDASIWTYDLLHEGHSASIS